MAFTWQQIIDRARSNFSRNSPILKQNLVDILELSYINLLGAHEWNAMRFNHTVAGGATPDQEFELPADFSRIDEESDFIVDNDSDIPTEILDKGELAYYEEAENRDDYKSYFTVERRVVGSVETAYLIFKYGRYPIRRISFTYIAKPERITAGGNLNQFPKYISPDYTDILIFALARDLMIGRNLDQTEQSTYNLLDRNYQQRLSQYLRFDNEITFNA